MFDFFCSFSPDGSGVATFPNPFQTIEAYKLLDYTTDNLSKDNCTIYTLNRKKNNWQDTYVGSRFTVLIYGYLFYLEEDKNTIKCKFTGEDVHDWLLSGKQIDTENFKGAYSILIFDYNSTSISVITDPLNLRYILYCEFRETILFSSSLDAIIAFMKHQGFKPELNWISFYQHYLLDFILNEETFIEDVHIVPPASILKSDSTGLRIEKYWDIFQEFPINKPIYSRRKSIRLLNEYLKNHIKNYIDTPDNSSIALTGGYDSRTLTALLGKKAISYSYFSYGYGLSWDVSIPKKISSLVGFDYQNYVLDKDFEKCFEQNVLLTLSLSNGTALFTQANIPYVYSNFLKNRTSIFSGLFGSELIKYPSSRGLFVDDAMFSLLFSPQPEKILENLIKRIPLKYSVKLNDDSFNCRLNNSINNNLAFKGHFKDPQKFFYYLVSIGARKYFAKEISMERPYVDNLVPFWDVDFIKLLHKTPYTWIYHWNNGKSAIKNSTLHQLYACLIEKNNSQLSWTISSHATRPKFLTHKIYLPFLVWDYFRFRKKIKKETVSYPIRIHNSHLKSLSINENPELNYLNKIYHNKEISQKEYYKLISFNQWLSINQISL